MIRKIILLLLAIVTAYFSWTSFKNGYFGIPNNERFQIEVPSFNEVRSNKSELQSNLEKLDSLNSSGIKNATNKVEQEIKNFNTKKTNYDLLAATASREDIEKANQERKYLLDYLWIEVGNYASDNNVKYKMTPNAEDSTISFDITGEYVSVINFVYDLENDPELDFSIDGIVIEGASSNSIVKANFKVENITVVTSPNDI